MFVLLLPFKLQKESSKSMNFPVNNVSNAFFQLIFYRRPTPSNAATKSHLVNLQLLGRVCGLGIEDVPELPVLVLVGLVRLPFGVQLRGLKNM